MSLLVRLYLFRYFWVGLGNDALKAPHHTRVRRQTSQDPLGNASLVGHTFEIGGLVILQATERYGGKFFIACRIRNT